MHIINSQSCGFCGAFFLNFTFCYVIQYLGPVFVGLFSPILREASSSKIHFFFFFYFYFYLFLFLSFPFSIFLIKAFEFLDKLL